MHRGGPVINGRGVVLLAMLFLAIAVGIGAKGFDSLTETSDATSIDAPHLPTATTETAREIDPTVAPAGQAPAPTQPPETGTTNADDAAGAGASIPDQADVATEETGKVVPEADVTAHAVYAYDVSSKTVLYELNSTTRMSVGSIVKVVTALVTVEHVALDDVVTIDETDLVDPGIYSNMGLAAGDSLTVEQLLQGLLIPSGGDAAQALARYVGGQLSGSDDPRKARAAFVDEMNAYVASLGLENTHFSNATGDEADDNYSSAEDVARLGTVLMQDDDLAAIVEMQGYDFVSVGGNEYSQVTTNELLGTDGIVGIKTGSTGEAGGCVVLAQKTVDGGLVVLTVLGSDITYDDLNRIVADSRWDDAREVLQAIDDGAS